MGDDGTSGQAPAASRPRMFGGHLEPVMLPWSWARDRLVASHNYWISTTRPDGRPHARPVWAVWLEDRLFFSTGSLAAANLEQRPDISVHTESGDEVVIVEGTATAVGERDVVRRVIDLYNPKYSSDLDADNLPGPFYGVQPRVVFAWMADRTGRDGGALFHGSSTKWVFRDA